MNKIDLIKQPVEKELEEFRGLFEDSLTSTDPLLGEVLAYIKKRSGKMMRPILVMLTAKLFGTLNESTFHAALSLELLHTASLVHDDVVDESDKRRGQSSVNAIYNNKVSVLVGDYMLATSLKHAALTGKVELVERLNVDRKEAKALIDGYFENYPNVKAYMDQSIQEAREKGYIETIFKRKRYLPDINSKNAVVRGYAERNAINAPIQGSAADIIKVAMIRIYQRFQEEGIRSKMILQVHDELNFSVLPEEKEKVQQIVISEMEAAYKMKAPLRADHGWGHNWLEAH